MPLIEVGSIADLAEGQPAVRRAGHRSIIVIRWKSEVFALRNICPHQSLPFTSAGPVRDKIGSTNPGELLITDETPVLVCPWHAFKFDIRTGYCVNDSRERVATYPVVIDDGMIFVEVR
jgi:3-phenylpropionate/trans-cinnamate dioxygenase ferredoxin subunit